MNHIKCLFFIFFSLFITCIQVSAKEVFNENIKIGILSKQKQVTVASDKKYCLLTNNTKIFFSKGKIDIKLKDKQITIANKNYNLPVKLVFNKCFMLNNKIYRGDLLITLNSKGNVLINEIKVEDYLRGILPKEANSFWNNDALKAQAVISRTYALKNVGKHSKDGYDLCATVHCQVYGGASCEASSCNKAIYNTNGEVLFYQNQLAQTLFHASCGGHTEDPKYVWAWKNKTPEYLIGITDSYCKNSPHQNWTTKISEKVIREKLINAGYKIGTIKKISTIGTTTGKAAKEISIKHSKGTLKLNSYTFRLTVNPNTIKSTSITRISKSNKDFIFKGVGWGHKVGLCQWGAKSMGDKNIRYKEILSFYYPKTSIRKIKYAK